MTTPVHELFPSLSPLTPGWLLTYHLPLIQGPLSSVCWAGSRVWSTDILLMRESPHQRMWKGEGDSKGIPLTYSVVTLCTVVFFRMCQVHNYTAHNREHSEGLTVNGLCVHHTTSQHALDRNTGRWVFHLVTHTYTCMRTTQKAQQYSSHHCGFTDAVCNGQVPSHISSLVVKSQVCIYSKRCKVFRLVTQMMTHAGTHARTRTHHHLVMQGKTSV